MASPVDAGRVATPFTSLATWSIPLPSGIVAGDLLIAYVRAGSTVSLNTGMTGWSTILFNESGDATDDMMLVFSKKADGTEGTSVSLGWSASAKGAAIVWRITGAADIGIRPPQISTMQYFTTVANTANPPSISPTGGSKDYLFLECCGHGGATWGITASAGYGNITGSGSTGGSAATNCQIGGASKQVTTATEDPGIMNHPAATGGGTAFTIAIHPGAPKYFGAVSLPITFGKSVAGDVVFPGQYYQLDSMDSATGWSVWFTENNPGMYAVTDEKFEGTGSIVFGGGDVTDKYGGLQKTIPAQNFTRVRAISFYVKTRKDVGYNTPNGRPLFIRLGTSSTVYWEGTIPANSVSDNIWTRLVLELQNFVAVGGITSWDAISYIAFSWATPGGAVAWYDDITFLPIPLTFSSALSLPITFDKSVSGIQTPASLYKAAVLADGPQGYWRMDEAVDLPQDSSPSGYHMTGNAGNTVAGVPGLLPKESTSKARGFSGSFVNRGLTYNLNTFSIEFWIKRTNPTLGEIIISQYNGGFEVSIGGDGSINVGKSYAGPLGATSVLKITDTNAHHVVITRAGIGGAVVFYLDGISETPIPTNPSFDFSVQANYAFFVGSQWGNYPVEGTLDELAIYPLVLSPAQVINHYNIATQAPTHYGQITQALTFSKDIQGKRTTFNSFSLPIAFTKDVKGIRKTFGQSAFPITFSKDIRGQRKAFGQLTFPITFLKDVRGQRKTFGQITFPITATIATAGSKLANIFYGAVALPITFAKDVNGVRKTFGQSATSITFTKDVKGSRKTFSQLTLPITFAKEVVGRKISFGQLSMQTLFGKEVSGVRKVFGQIAFPIIFLKDVNGQRKTFGQLLSPFIFGKAVSGQRKTFGQIISPLLFTITTAGIKKANTFYGVLSSPITFVKDVKGSRKTFSQTATSVVFSKDVKAIRKTFGKTDLPIIFTKAIGGQQNLYGRLSMQTLFGKEVAGRRKTFGQIAVPVVFSKAVAGRKQTFGNVVLPINTTIVVNGFVSGTKKYGAISLPVVFGKEIIGRRKTFGQLLSPFIFGEASQGTRRAFGKFYLPLDFDAAVKSGPVGIHGQIAFPVIVSFETVGRIMRAGVVLNLAESIYLGVESVLAVYTKNQQVWPLFVFDPTAITGLMGWYDASQLTLADGALVNPWPDLSGNNRPLAASTGYPVAPGTPPTCKINGLDGKRVVHYTTNGDNILVIPSQAMYGHIFIITKFNADAFPDYNGLICGQGDNTYFLIGTAGSNRFYSPSAEWGTVIYRSNGVIDPLRVAPMNTWKQINFSIGIPWTFRFQVGLDRVYPPRYWHGDIAEIVAYDRVLLDDERQRVEVYLQEKWGLT